MRCTRSASRFAGATWTRSNTSTTPPTSSTSRSAATSGSSRVLRETDSSWDFVIARVAIDYRRELRLEDERSSSRCRLERIGTSSLTTREEIRTGGELAAEAEAVLVARDGATDGRGRCRPPSARRSRPRPTGAERLFSPLQLGPVELPNRIVSTAHQTTLVARPPADRRLHRLPRGAGARRCRADRARGHRRASVRPAHLAHARRLSAGDRRRRTGGSPPRCSRTGRDSSSSSCTAAASRSPGRRARPRWPVGGSEPALPRRAARAARSTRSRS